VIVFADRVLPHLLADPVRNNLTCGLILRRRDGRAPAEPDGQWLWVCDNSGELCGVAAHAPPYPLLLTDMPPAAVDALADHLATDHPTAVHPTAVQRTADGRPMLPGVNGPSALAARFARRFAAATGCTARMDVGLRMLRLETVRPPAHVSGRLREAVPADRDLLVAWSAAVMAEALQEDPADPAVPVDLRLSRPGLLWIWEDGGTPVSKAYRTEPVLGVTRVSGVYTPPELRGRGYASACVAGLSQAALDSGIKQCALFTDLANPTSNKIYQALGYEPVVDAQVWRFR
jgi:GNAT superfamily N-acetyltransferase